MAFRIFMLTLFSVALLFGESLRASEQPDLKDIISAPQPIFPPELLRVKPIDGDVVVVFTVAESGAVSDSFALQATNSAFANAATRAVNMWQFMPKVEAQSLGDVWPRRKVTQFKFRRSGSVTNLSHAEAARDGFATTATAEVFTVQWDELDHEPEWITTGMPQIPFAAVEHYSDFPLNVNFIVDRSGYVRVPVISGTNDVELAQAVLDSVRQWRYSVPIYKEKAVSAEVTRILILDNPLER